MKVKVQSAAFADTVKVDDKTTTQWRTHGETFEADVKDPRVARALERGSLVAADVEVTPVAAPTTVTPVATFEPLTAEDLEGMTVEDVAAYLEAHPEQASHVGDLEGAGKQRAGVLKLTGG